MVSETVPQFTPTDQTLATMMQQAIAAYPTEAPRIRKGAEIVERGGVRPPNANHTDWLIGIYRFYTVGCTCECPDTLERGTKRCKHRWAKALYRKMQSLPPVRSLEFYADLQGEAGIATVWEDGRIVFQAFESAERIACAYAEVVLGGRRDLVDAAYAA